jgi:hypothetical protein
MASCVIFMTLKKNDGGAISGRRLV